MAASRAPYADPDGDDIRRIIGTAPHEFFAHLNFNEAGLMPWFACDRAVKDGGGAVTTITELDALDGDEAKVTLNYPDGCGLVLPEDGVTPAGTEIELEKVREFTIHVKATDETGQRKATYRLRPRWMNLKGGSDDNLSKIPVPESLANRETDAVNVRVNGSNIEFDAYPALLREAAEAVGVSGTYFETIHATSNIQDAERYVRVHRDESGPIHARTGPMAGLGHLLEGDRSGYRQRTENDTKTEGYYNTTTLGPLRIAEVFPNHALPKEFKHYYVREPNGRENSDPLAHPKLGASYQVNRWDGTLSFDQEGLDQLSRELDESIYAVLADAGLDLRAGGDTYVEDAYFDAENTTTDAAVVDLELTQIRHEQELVVNQQLASGMSPVEQETLRTLVSDGGHVSPRDIAETTGRHPDSVYDALGRLHGLVDHQYGSVELRSTYLSELVADALQNAEDAVARATNAAAEAVHAADRGLDDTTSAFLAWCEAHGVHHSRDGDAIDLDAGDVEGVREVKRIVREGYELWRQMNRDETAYRLGTVWYHVPAATLGTHYLGDPTQRQKHNADIFRLLDH
jgi:hypothetical protein